MPKYLDRKPGDVPPAPDVVTRIRSNPRLKAVLWSLSVAAAILTLIALFASREL
ncbi:MULTISPECIES: hypothetical protein [unclassified Sinorhizobium]|uniref:hypothetical protein n=1 Tax=unclassified Sinorhizobium TaxID=2613772 RepID=UPI003525D55F